VEVLTHRCCAGAFRYGGGAPEEFDEETALEIIAVWKEKRLVNLAKGCH